MTKNRPAFQQEVNPSADNSGRKLTQPARVATTKCDLNYEMKRIEVTLVDDGGRSLLEPAFVESCSELPHTVMQAADEFLDAHDGELHLPLNIRVQPSRFTATC